MDLKGLLEKKRDSIVDRWIQVVQETYPPETVEFFRKQKNEFANPIGFEISRTMGPLFDELLKGVNDSEKISFFLDNIIKVRAVQDFAPSAAVAIVFLLKKIIRKELAEDIKEAGLFEDLLEFESRIDYLALLAFDVYMGRREKVWRVKLNEFVRVRPFLIEDGTGAMCLSYKIRQEQRQGKNTGLSEGLDIFGQDRVR